VKPGKIEYTPVESRIESMVQMLLDAGYAPDVAMSLTHLPVSLAKHYQVELSAGAQKLMLDGRNPDHVYTACWNLLISASGHPLVPGGLYCRTLQEGCIEMDKLARKFCYHYWKGEARRPSKKDFGI
jgi:hypothetical protein